MAWVAITGVVVASGVLPALWAGVVTALAGFGVGLAGPSRDMLIKRAAPPGATGRVYGTVYSGLDIGQALAPLVFGRLMDLHQYSAVWVGLALVQGVLIVSAFQVRRVRRELRPAPAAG